MVSEERRDYLDCLWGEETSAPATWEWRDDLNTEELALVESWEEKYCSAVGTLAMDSVGREGR